MKSFLICPVRGYDSALTEKYMKQLEAEGYEVHWPPRDTNQEDSTGLRICRDNLAAIRSADAAHFMWDGESQGVLFDLGIAFSLGKKVVPLQVPPATTHKSFQNMVTALAKEQQ